LSARRSDPDALPDTLPALLSPGGWLSADRQWIDECDVEMVSDMAGSLRLCYCVKPEHEGLPCQHYEAVGEVST
jgi:hypothetical protein